MFLETPNVYSSDSVVLPFGLQYRVTDVAQCNFRFAVSLCTMCTFSIALEPLEDISLMQAIRVRSKIIFILHTF